jgi:hypothetical protein
MRVLQHLFLDALEFLNPSWISARTPSSSVHQSTFRSASRWLSGTRLWRLPAVTAPTLQAMAHTRVDASSAHSSVGASARSTRCCAAAPHARCRPLHAAWPHANAIALRMSRHASLSDGSVGVRPSGGSWVRAAHFVESGDGDSIQTALRRTCMMAHLRQGGRARRMRAHRRERQRQHCAARAWWLTSVGGGVLATLSCDKGLS